MPPCELKDCLRVYVQIRGWVFLGKIAPPGGELLFARLKTSDLHPGEIAVG